MKKILAVLGAASMIMGLTVLSASAAPAGSVNFTCDMTYYSPGSGSAHCEGLATGVVVSGSTVIPCLPSCPLDAYISSYSELCIVDEAPLVGFYSGEIYVDGIRMGSFTWLRVGVSVTFTNDGELRGQAAWAPVTVPIPTCPSPGPLAVKVTGHFHATP